MRIAVASDHAGFRLKECMIAHLGALGHEVDDLGTTSGEVSVDYPDYGTAAGQAVVDGRADLAICACGTGIGISIAANKVRGVRAAVVHDVSSARLARRHNDANVLCLGGRLTTEHVAVEAVDAFLGSTYEAGGRHDRRIAKITDYERQQAEA